MLTVKEKILGSIPGLIVWAVVIGMFVGWVMNIMTLINDTTMEVCEGVVRLVGIFLFPVGALLGYL